MMQELHKLTIALQNKLQIAIIRGRAYKKSKFAVIGEKILKNTEVFDQYYSLIELYKGDKRRINDHKKAVMNIGYFIEMIYRLNLENGERLSILDLGSRAGLFPFYCNYYGHDAFASDMKGVLEKSPNCEILELLNVRSVPLTIVPLKRLPDLGRKFDLVTGFRTRFHSRYAWETGEEKDEHWGFQEWSYFLDDIARYYLNENGRLYLVLNRLQPREAKRKIAKEQVKFFHRLGGQLKYNQFVFKREVLIEKL